MTPQFYLYGTYKEGRDTLLSHQFSFVIDEYRDLALPSFLIWLYRETEGEALLCKIRRTTRPADIGMTLHVYDALPIKLVSHGLLNSIWPDSKRQIGMSAREQASDMILMRDLFVVPDDKSEMVKNAILKSNRGTIDETYFVIRQEAGPTDLVLEFRDAFQTGSRIFGLHPRRIPELTEQQILDFDVESLYADATKRGATADGKHFFEHGNRRLYIHKVDRTQFERHLGVDLIYNYLDERRIVFVQYKCQKTRGKYYPSADASHDSEIRRMDAIPGMQNCDNRRAVDGEGVRLCRCPAFIKLCKREIANSHSVPVGVYYPLCVWKWLLRAHTAVSVRNEPQFNNQQFQELVKNGFIGSTPDQSVEIERHLIEAANDDRLKLIFEEMSVE